MAYSEFTLRKARQELGISIAEGGRFLPDVKTIAADALLQQELAEGLPLVFCQESLEGSKTLKI